MKKDVVRCDCYALVIAFFARTIHWTVAYLSGLTELAEFAILRQ